MRLYMYLWCSAFFSHSSLRNVSRKPTILNRMWCYCCFYLHWLIFCRDKLTFLTTNVLSRQAHFCRNKRCTFVATKKFLQQKWYDGGRLPCSRRLRTDERLAGNWYFRMHFRWLRYSCQSVNQSINPPIKSVKNINQSINPSLNKNNQPIHQ